MSWVCGQEGGSCGCGLGWRWWAGGARLGYSGCDPGDVVERLSVARAVPEEPLEQPDDVLDRQPFGQVRFQSRGHAQAYACQQSGLPAQLDRKETGGSLPLGGSRVLGIDAPSLPEAGGLFIRGKLNAYAKTTVFSQIRPENTSHQPLPSRPLYFALRVKVRPLQRVQRVHPTTRILATSPRLSSDL